MDDSQDWFLSSKPGLQFASEADGYTTIAFERKLNTCDRNDTDITVMATAVEVYFLIISMKYYCVFPQLKLSFNRCLS